MYRNCTSFKKYSTYCYKFIIDCDIPSIIENSSWCMYLLVLLFITIDVFPQQADWSPSHTDNKECIVGANILIKDDLVTRVQTAFTINKWLPSRRNNMFSGAVSPSRTTKGKMAPTSVFDRKVNLVISPESGKEVHIFGWPVQSMLNIGVW